MVEQAPTTSRYASQHQTYTSLTNVHQEERAKRQVVTSDWLKLEDGLGCTSSRFQFLPTESIKYYMHGSHKRATRASWPHQILRSTVSSTPATTFKMTIQPDAQKRIVYTNVYQYCHKSLHRSNICETGCKRTVPGMSPSGKSSRQSRAQSLAAAWPPLGSFRYKAFPSSVNWTTPSLPWLLCSRPNYDLWRIVITRAFERIHNIVDDKPHRSYSLIGSVAYCLRAFYLLRISPCTL